MVRSKRVPLRESLRKSVLEDNNYICIYCGSEATTVDHIYPYSYVETHDPENLVACCAMCNSLASNNVFDNFIDKLRYIQEQRKKRGLVDSIGSPPDKIYSNDKESKNDVTSLTNGEIAELRSLVNFISDTLGGIDGAALSLGTSRDYIIQIMNKKKPGGRPIYEKALALETEIIENREKYPGMPTRSKRVKERSRRSRKKTNRIVSRGASVDLQSLISKRGISYIAKRMGYSYQYVYMVANEKTAQTEAFRLRLERTFRQYPNTVTTRYPPHAEAERLAALALTMEERREAFKEYLERKER